MRTQRQSQQGIALYIVLVIVLLSMLLALWASRTAIFNEIIVGNDADYQRAFEAAQAMVQDAELDIRGERANGALCLTEPARPLVCRPAGGSGVDVRFIDEDKDLIPLLNTLASKDSSGSGCWQGLCQKRLGSQDFWSNTATLNNMIRSSIGARYGQYTGATTGTASNPILANTSAGQGAWYWIEIMPYDATPTGLLSGGASKLGLNLKPNVVYRITAIARGLKPNTQAVIQTTYARPKMQN